MVGRLADDAAGMYASDTIYSDLDVDRIESVTGNEHREVDLAILDGDKRGASLI